MPDELLVAAADTANAAFKALPGRQSTYTTSSMFMSGGMGLGSGGCLRRRRCTCIC
jgi:hypothetical protein